jgi:8-oxo-dGTP diphosphatase
MRAGRAVVVLSIDGRVAVIKRWRPDAGHYAVLPGGGIEDGESVEDAAMREATEELGLEVRVVETLEVEHLNEPHTYLRCEVVGGAFGTGTGEEYTGERPSSRGTYEPALVPLDELAAVGLQPAWLHDRLPIWLD